MKKLTVTAEVTEGDGPLAGFFEGMGEPTQRSSHEWRFTANLAESESIEDVAAALNEIRERFTQKPAEDAA